MDAQQNTKRILIFIAIAFGISCTVTLGTYLSGAMKANPILAGTLANYIVVMSPALANVATRLITREGWRRTWLWPNFRRGWPFFPILCSLRPTRRSRPASSRERLPAGPRLRVGCLRGSC